MLSNQILQRTIYEIGDILECNCSIWDMDGFMPASVGTEKLFVKQAVNDFITEVMKSEGVTEYLGRDMAFFVVYDELNPVYVLVFGASRILRSKDQRKAVCQSTAEYAAHEQRTNG